LAKYFGVVLVLNNQEVVMKMEVKVMPTFLLMMEGAKVDKLVGENPN
jgi:thioredoxin 1